LLIFANLYGVCEYICVWLVCGKEYMCVEGCLGSANGTRKCWKRWKH
jgi:hypothetical protein